MTQPSASILATFSDQRLWLAEYLTDCGYDVRLTDWDPSDNDVWLVLTDASVASRLSDGLRQVLNRDEMGWLSLGPNLLANLNRVPDASLPVDVSGREVAIAIGILETLVAVRRTCLREREECQYWTQLALHDVLTGLPNRRAWDQRLACELAGRQPLAIAMLDLDGFKQINDLYGHQVGDLVLRETAAAFRASLRHSDFVARFGGDEFTLMIPSVNRPVALMVIDRLRQAVSRRLAAASLPPATLSAGFVTFGPHDPRVASDVLTQISKSLRASKPLNVGHREDSTCAADNLPSRRRNG